jgi:hypothetical protein
LLPEGKGVLVVIRPPGWLGWESKPIEYNSAAPFIRDGIDSPNVVAEVKWRGSFITSKFTKSDGIFDFPFLHGNNLKVGLFTLEQEERP